MFLWESKFPNIEARVLALTLEECWEMVLRSDRRGAFGRGECKL